MGTGVEFSLVSTLGIGLSVFCGCGWVFSWNVCGSGKAVPPEPVAEGAGSDDVSGAGAMFEYVVAGAAGGTQVGQLETPGTVAPE